MYPLRFFFVKGYFLKGFGDSDRDRDRNRNRNWNRESGLESRKSGSRFGSTSGSRSGSGEKSKEKRERKQEEIRRRALRVIPAETRLTVYRRRPVLGDHITSFKVFVFSKVAFFGQRK